MGTEFGVLVVGVGFIADSHVAAISAHPGATVAGLVDLDPARARAASYRNGGVRCTTDLAEALAWLEVDGVIVCTPNSTHAGIATAVAAAGKHLLVEKPLATTVADARQVRAVFAAAGLVVSAAHTHRHYDYALAVRAAIRSGDIGTPALARLTIAGGWIWPDWNSWMIDPAVSGGHSLHNGVHLLDLVGWWLDAEPVSVYARGRKQTASELDIHDYLEFSIGYRGGAQAVCEMSRAHRPASLGYRDVYVVGERGTISQRWDGESAVLFTERGMEGVPAAGGDGFARQLAAWLDAIDGKEPVMSAADAVRAVALGVAAERSIASGEPVPLGDVLDEVLDEAVVSA